MTDSEKIVYLLREMVENISYRLQDNNIYEPTPFYQGYRSGIAVVAKEIEGAFDSIRNITDAELTMFDVDAWYKEGKGFRWG